MKAIVLTEYGPPEAFKLADVEKPSPKDNQILIKVYASSINSWDWEALKGTPFANRVTFGIFKPNNVILGCDVAGVVEAVGRDARRFSPGDEVYGDLSGNGGFGCFAEYVCADENLLAQKPAGMTFEQAAAIPQAAVLALQGLRYNGEIRAGQKVLFNGVGGGAGTFAVQMAKAMGAEVTGVDSSVKLETIRALGADHVMDYASEDFTKNGKRYDLIVDVVARHSFFEYRRSLNVGGGLAIIGGSTGRLLQIALLGLVVPGVKKGRMGLMLHRPNKDDLALINEMFESGKVAPVIDRVYTLGQAAEAFRYYGEGLFKGKIVISIAQGSQAVV